MVLILRSIAGLPQHIPEARFDVILVKGKARPTVAIDNCPRPTFNLCGQAAQTTFLLSYAKSRRHVSDRRENARGTWSANMRRALI